ncbi:pimeloyl-ACP methyl ester carboxylesterase [Litoreibacter ponti]|uniref:Pimeloyl-ACP methyl ester carboxylesterase n=2 Tax=Litoreibacter ponti TaxID=1510457 RepID=A0A2T6BLR5_9RHOB|nr:pimeloyl-ACP methyl ester carboxylesterase [Litoreibacter ponti]
MLADRRVWRGVVPQLDHLTRHLVELPGHGDAPDWDGGAYQDQALGLLDAQAQGPIHLIGHSFGATVALRFAVEHPEKLASLTLIEPVFFHAARRTDQAAFAQYAETGAPVIDAIRAGETHKAAEMFLGAWGAPGMWEALPDKARDAIAGQMHLIDVSAPSLIDDTGNIWPRLDRITCPVLYVQGANSPPVIAAIAHGLEQQMKVDATLTIEGAGHMIPLTHGEELGRAIAQFTA